MQLFIVQKNTFDSMVTFLTKHVLPPSNFPFFHSNSQIAILKLIKEKDQEGLESALFEKRCL